jgi:hypothetical protein
MDPIKITVDTPLTLTPSELNIVLAALDELPHKVARPVLDSIHAQALAFHTKKDPPE